MDSFDVDGRASTHLDAVELRRDGSRRPAVGKEVGRRKVGVHLAPDAAQAPHFYSVSQAAQILGTAPVTLYRAIRAGEFPAVRIRGRLIVPAKAIEAMAEAAVSDQMVMDASGWVTRR